MGRKPPPRPAPTVIAVSEALGTLKQAIDLHLVGVASVYAATGFVKAFGTPKLSPKAQAFYDETQRARKESGSNMTPDEFWIGALDELRHELVITDKDYNFLYWRQKKG